MFLTTDDNLPGTLEDNAGGVREGIASCDLGLGAMGKYAAPLPTQHTWVPLEEGGGKSNRENGSVTFILDTAPTLCSPKLDQCGK